MELFGWKPRIKRAAFVLFIIYIVIILVGVYIVLLAGQQFAYDLSVMPRSEALAVVQGLYLQYQEGLMAEGMYVSQEAMKNLLNDYIDDAAGLNLAQKAVLSQRRNIKIAGQVIAPLIITLLTTYELWET